MPHASTAALITDVLALPGLAIGGDPLSIDAEAERISGNEAVLEDPIWADDGSALWQAFDRLESQRPLAFARTAVARARGYDEGGPWPTREEGTFAWKCHTSETEPDAPNDYMDPLSICDVHPELCDAIEDTAVTIDGVRPGTAQPCSLVEVAPSPARAGPFQYTSFDYQAIPEFDIVDAGGRFPIHALVYVPRTNGLQAGKQAEGFPLVIIVHGRHQRWMSEQVDNPAQCRLPSVNLTARQCTRSGGVTAPDGFKLLPSYMGYSYVQEALATHGIASASIDLSLIEAYPHIQEGVPARRWKAIVYLVRSLLRQSGGDRRFVPLDFSRICLFGHSRGGGAVIDAANHLHHAPIRVDKTGVLVKVAGVITLVPHPETIGAPPADANYPFLSIVASEDEDGCGHYWHGQVFYDLKKPTPFKCQVYVRGANHKSFNRYWSYYWMYEPRTRDMLSDSMHEKVLSAYVTAFNRVFLLGQRDQLAFLVGKLVPADVPADAVELSFQAAVDGVQTVDDFEDSVDTDTNAMGGRNRSVGALVLESVLTAARHQPSLDRGNPPETFYIPRWPYGNAVEYLAPGADVPPFNGFSKGLLLSEAQFRSHFPAPLDLRGAELWVRAALVPFRKAGRWYDLGRRWRFELGIEDSRGRLAWTSSDAGGGLSTAHDRQPSDFETRICGSYRRRAVLRTLRFPMTCFSPEAGEKYRMEESIIQLDRRLAFEAASAVHLRVGEGLFAFDDIQIVHPASLGRVVPGFRRFGSQ